VVDILQDRNTTNNITLTTKVPYTVFS